MKTDEQNRAIAIACGFKPETKRVVRAGWGRQWFDRPEGWADLIRFDIGEEIPRFTTDLHAMHKAVMAMTDGDRYEFCNRLATVCHEDARNHPHSAIMISINATAPQRAEAFLRTLNLWQEP